MDREGGSESSSREMVVDDSGTSPESGGDWGRGGAEKAKKDWMRVARLEMSPSVLVLCCSLEGPATSADSSAMSGAAVARDGRAGQGRVVT